MSSIKLKHSGGNGVIIAAPDSNPASDRTLKLPSNADGTILTTTSFKSAVLKTIKAGGCNCSRVNFIGSYYAALKGKNSIPKSWIKKTMSAKKILKIN